VVTDRLCWAILGVAMAAAAALILYLNRGTTFNADELVWVYSSPTLSLTDVLEPYNGSLIATNRLVYKAILETLGAGYLPFRLLVVLAILVVPALFYALAKRRIGALPALAPAIVLLFFGSAGEYAVAPIGFIALFSIAAGLGALLALERDDRVGDAAACGLIVLSVATFSTGLAFLAGAAISVLIRPDRWRRSWIFVVPLVLYGAWYLWALDLPRAPAQDATLSNVLLIPNYVAESLATATGALAGLVDFLDANQSMLEIDSGRPLAAVAIVAFALRIRRGNLPPSLWVSLGLVLAVWALGAVAVLPGFRGPHAARYTYIGAIGVLLAATDAARGIRFSRLGLAVLFVVCAVSLSGNIALLRDSAALVRDNYSISARAQFGMLELARDDIEADFDPNVKVPGNERYAFLAPGAEPYFDVLDRYGSLALALPELERQGESVRQGADRLLAQALGLRLEPSPPRVASGRCEALRGNRTGAAIGFELPSGGAAMRARAPAPTSVTVGRFASSSSAEVGSLSPGETATLRIPRDPSPKPWRASLASASSVEVCALP
jgi:hypothetical protein